MCCVNRHIATDGEGKASLRQCYVNFTFICLLLGQAIALIDIHRATALATDHRHHSPSEHLIIPARAKLRMVIEERKATPSTIDSLTEETNKRMQLKKGRDGQVVDDSIAAR